MCIYMYIRMIVSHYIHTCTSRAFLLQMEQFVHMAFSDQMLGEMASLGEHHKICINMFTCISIGGKRSERFCR